jgi:cell division protein FtsQ
VLREAGRRRLRRLLWVLGVAGVAAAIAGAVVSPLLDVNQVEVTGIDEVHADEVRTVARVETGAALLLLDTGAVRTRVEELIWVDEAAVVRQLPGTLRIDITPRFPVAWRSTDGGAIELIDGRGVAIMTASTTPAGLPELQVGDGSIEAAARAARSIPEQLAPYVARITTDEGGMVHVWLVTGTDLRLGDPNGLAIKLRAAEALLVALGGVPVGYVDVSVPSAPVTG